MARYSDSALFLAKTDCFLLCQVTKFPQTEVQYPDVDFLSVIDPAQSASVKAITSRSLVFAKKRPLPGVCFKYLKIRYTTSK